MAAKLLDMLLEEDNKKGEIENDTIKKMTVQSTVTTAVTSQPAEENETFDNNLKRVTSSDGAEIATTTTEPNSEAWLMNHLRKFYTQYIPEKLSTYESVRSNYIGKEARLLEDLYRKYNVQIPLVVKKRLESIREASRKGREQFGEVVDEGQSHNSNQDYFFMTSNRSRHIARAAMDRKVSFKQRVKQSKQTKFFERRVLMEGYLEKRSDYFKKWNTRWFVLKGTTLQYFTNATEAAPSRCNSPKGEFSFDISAQLKSGTEPTVFTLSFRPQRLASSSSQEGQEQKETKLEVVILAADSTTTKQAWMVAINEVILHVQWAAGIADEEERSAASKARTRAPAFGGTSTLSTTLDESPRSASDVQTVPLNSKCFKERIDTDSPKTKGLEDLSSSGWAIQAYIEQLLMDPHTLQGKELIDFSTRFQVCIFETDVDLMIEDVQSTVSSVHEHIIEETPQLDDEQEYQTYIAVLRAVLSNCVTRLVVCVTSACAARDAEMIERVFWLRDHFSDTKLAGWCGMSWVIDDGKNISQKWMTQVELLNAAYAMQLSPVEQTFLLSKTMNSVSDHLKRERKLSTIGADDLIPSFTFVVLMSQWQQPYTMIKLLKGVLDSRRMRGETMWAVVSFEASCYYIRNMLWEKAMTSRSDNRILDNM